MKPVDFDNTRRHLQIMLRGQELSWDQAAELATIIAERRRSVPQGYTNRRPPEPPDLPIPTEIRAAKVAKLDAICRRFDREVDEIMSPLEVSRPFPDIQADPSLPPGTLEMRYGDRVVGRIENIGEDEA